MSGLSYLPSKNNIDNSSTSTFPISTLRTPTSKSTFASVSSLRNFNYHNIDRSFISSSATSQSMLNNQLPSILSNSLPTAGKRKDSSQNSQVDSLITHLQQLVPQGLYAQSEDMGFQLYQTYLGDYPSGDMSQQYQVVPPQSNTSPISNTTNQGRYSSNMPPSYPNYSLSPSVGRNAPEHGATSPSGTHHQPSLGGANEFDNNVDQGYGTSPSSNVYMMPGNSSTPHAATRNSIQSTGLYVMAGPNAVNSLPVFNPSASSMFPSNNNQHPLLFSNMYMPPVQMSGSKNSSVIMPINAKENVTGLGSHQSPSQSDHQSGIDLTSSSKLKKGKVRKNSTSSTSSTGSRGPSANGQHKPPAKRSRMGCLTCRQRKKRCCETRPRCTECARLKLNCVWPIPGSEHKNKPKEVKNNEQTIDHEIYGKIKVLRGIVEYRSK